MKREKNNEWVNNLLVYGVMVCCTLILVSLCFNEGLDYDESFSYSMVRDNSLWEIPHAMLESEYNDIIPLWYMALKVWICIFGESIVVCKLFTVAGSVATMFLGATVVRRNWGRISAVLFIVPAGLAPGLMHVGVNIRTYSWTIFLVAATALIAYEILQNSKNTKLWLLLFLTTIAGLFCHHFTAFGFLFIYFYLFIELLLFEKKQIWKVFVCGFGAVVPFCVWLFVSDFFAYKNEENTMNLSMLDMDDVSMFMFNTYTPWTIEMCKVIFVLSIFMFFVLNDRFVQRDKVYTILCLTIFPLNHVVATLIASSTSHFILPRHTMHAMALSWLGLAIILPKVSRKTSAFAAIFMVGLCLSNYVHNYDLEYNTLPYMEETKAFVKENMEPGDIVVFNVEEKFGTLYSCHMPEQEFVHLESLSDADIAALAGNRVWYFLRDDNFFTEEQQKQHNITYENMGHYGFQIINDCTDFDILKVEIAGGAE